MFHAEGLEHVFDELGHVIEHHLAHGDEVEGDDGGVEAAVAHGDGHAAGRVCVCGDSSAGLGRGAGDHGAGGHVFIPADVAAEFDRPDDSARAEQWHHVRDDAPALVSAATSGARAVCRPL